MAERLWIESYDVSKAVPYADVRARVSMVFNRRAGIIVLTTAIAITNWWHFLRFLLAHAGLQGKCIDRDRCDLHS